jgi:hypothetical protein
MSRARTSTIPYVLREIILVMKGETKRGMIEANDSLANLASQDKDKYGAKP